VLPVLDREKRRSWGVVLELLIVFVPDHENDAVLE
jgi:hypothetical protein